MVMVPAETLNMLEREAEDRAAAYRARILTAENETNHWKAENERLRALSQNNAHSWDRLVRERNELLEVLKAFVAQEVDYMTINNLGNPEKQHNVKWARAVIAKRLASDHET